jgi:hypothetical protein
VIGWLIASIISAWVILEDMYSKNNMNEWVQKLNHKKNILQKFDFIMTPEMKLTSDKSKINDLIEMFMLTVWTTVSNIDQLKWILAENLEIFKNNQELFWNNIIYTIGKKWLDTLVVDIEIDGKLVLSKTEYSRQSFHKSGTMNKYLEDKLENEIWLKIYDIMNKSKTYKDFKYDLGDILWLAINDTFNKTADTFKVSSTVYWKYIYIKIIEPKNKFEYNASYLLDEHLQ